MTEKSNNNGPLKLCTPKHHCFTCFMPLTMCTPAILEHECGAVQCTKELAEVEYGGD